MLILTSTLAAGGVFLSNYNNDAYAAEEINQENQVNYGELLINNEVKIDSKLQTTNDTVTENQVSKAKVDSVESNQNISKNNNLNESSAMIDSQLQNNIQFVNPEKKYFESYLDKNTVSQREYKNSFHTRSNFNFVESTPRYTTRSMEPYASAQWLTKYQLTAGYGHYNLNINNGMHYGADFAMPIGTPVRAITGGKIIEAGWSPYGGGNQIGVKEPDGSHYQWYMHLSQLNVRVGDYISTGQIIGKSGSTGFSTGPHLHFQRMVGGLGNNYAQNPIPFLKQYGYGSNTSGYTPPVNRVQAPSTNSTYKVDGKGTYYKAESASFTANYDIKTRLNGPFRSNPQSGVLHPGQTIKYDTVMKQDGHVWVVYTGYSGKRIYLPVRTWDKNSNTLGPLWGIIN